MAEPRGLFSARLSSFTLESVVHEAGVPGTSYLGFWLNLHLHFPPVGAREVIRGGNAEPCPPHPTAPALTQENNEAEGTQDRCANESTDPEPVPVWGKSRGHLKASPGPTHPSRPEGVS